jgi:hypothetical protein
MTTKEAASKLKIEPKHLRSILRKIGRGSKGKGYELNAADITLVEKHLASETVANEPAPKKKAAKKK